MAASDKDLGELHSAVAVALKNVITNGVPTENGTAPAPPAYLGAAIAFLKNNNITADLTKNEDLQDLQNALNKRRSRLTPEALQDAAREFAASNGDMLQ